MTFEGDLKQYRFPPQLTFEDVNIINFMSSVRRCGIQRFEKKLLKDASNYTRKLER